MPFCLCLGFRELPYKMSTFVVSRWVAIVEVARVYIFAVLEVDLLVVVVTDSESLAMAWRASLLIELPHIVRIWGGFLFGVAQNHL